MRWWPWRRRRDQAAGSREAREAHTRATDDLAATYRRWDRITPTTGYLREAGLRNHFSESILDAFRGH